MNDDVIKNLKRLLRNGRPVLFVGAGFSKGGLTKQNELLPDGNSLKKDIIEKILLYKNTDDEYSELMENSLSEICEFCSTTVNKERLDDYLVEVYSNCKPASYHKAFAQYRWDKIYTTNIDDIIENVFDPELILVQNLSRPKTVGQADRIEYIKLHGCVRNPSAGFVFTSKEYIDSMLKSRDYRFNQFGMDIQYKDFIFVGTDYNESNLNYYLMLYQQNLGSSKGQIFFINPSKSLVLEQKIKSIGGNIIRWKTDEFADFLQKEILVDIPSDGKILTEIDGFYPFSENIVKLKAYKSYRSDLYLGQEPKWQDILNDWDFKYQHIIDSFDIYMSYISSKNVKHSVYSIVGKAMSGKSVYLKRLGLYLHEQGYHVFDFVGRRFNYYTFVQSAREQSIDRYCLIIDNASYYYGALRSLLKIFPRHKELVILTSSRPFFHNRKRYNLVTESFFEYHIEPGIDDEFAFEIDTKLDKKGYLGKLKKKSHMERINFINSANDVSNILFSITYGKGFYRRFQSELVSSFKRFSDIGRDLLVSLAIFEKMDLAYYPLEMLTLIYQDKAKDALLEIEDFIRYNNLNGIELRNSYLVSTILQKASFIKKMEIVREILVNISPQIVDDIPTYWNEIQSSLMKEKLLRKKIGLKTSAIKNMLFDIQNYYDDNYNYWIQVGISEQIDFEYEKALNHFHQAEALYPNSYMVRNAIARNFLKQANFSEDLVNAKPYFEEGERLMLALIAEREEFQVKAFSTHCYLYEKINYLQKFSILPSDQELKDMFSLLKTVLDKDTDDPMAKHISNKFFRFLQEHQKTNIIDISFYDLSSLKVMFEQYDIDIQSILEDFEIED